MTTGSALLHLESDLDGPHVEAFTRWCNDVHHPELLHVEGFLAVRRFEHAGGDAGPRFLTAYELATAGAASSDAYLEHGRTSTPMPAEVAAGLRFGRAVYRAVAAHGDLTPGPAVLQVLGAGAAEAAELAARPGLRGARAFVDAADGGVAPALVLAELDTAEGVVPTVAGAVVRRYRQVFPAAGAFTG